MHDNSISSLIWSWGAPHNADVSQGLHQPAELAQLSSPSTKEGELVAKVSLRNPFISQRGQWSHKVSISPRFLLRHLTSSGVSEIYKCIFSPVFMQSRHHSPGVWFGRKLTSSLTNQERFKSEQKISKVALQHGCKKWLHRKTSISGVLQSGA